MAPSILLVEDEEAVRSVLVEIFEESGLEVVAVASGRAARSILALDGGRFDLVMTDVVMPGESGLDLCRTLRADQFSPPIVVIRGDQALLDFAQDAGATVCLAKPFTIDGILAAIDRGLGHETVSGEPAGS
jgi:CheY-like chemotaxis protein